MRYISMFLAAVFLMSAPAFADPTCSQYMPDGCEDYPKGLTELLELEPLEYGYGGTYDAVGFAETSVSSIGLNEYVEFVDGNPDDVPAANLNPLEVKAIQQLDALVVTQAAEIADLQTRVTALEGE